MFLIPLDIILLFKIIGKSNRYLMNCTARKAAELNKLRLCTMQIIYLEKEHCNSNSKLTYLNGRKCQT
uniref:Uncharacterized protein n=1 Tax=Arundo donax TaxID=35708 RepID=A0A0A9EST0_ARUDO